MPRLLDLFCGAGGAAQGYADAGFDVFGVDIAPQPRYPFPFIQGDALAPPVRLEDFDVIHASPPCQDYSTAMRHLAKPQPRLIEPVRELLSRSGRPWIIENVPGAPLARQPDLLGGFGVELCGTMFGLPVWRHRLFEASFALIPAPRGCDHSTPAMNPHNQAGRDRIYAEYGGKQNPDPIWNAAMGVPWMNKHEGREAIPPRMTAFLGEQLIQHLSGMWRRYGKHLRSEHSEVKR